MAERGKRMKGRIIFLEVHRKDEPRKFYMGSSVKQIALRAGLHPQTLVRTSKLAETTEDHSYETTNYLIVVAGKDDFIRGLTRHGHFEYAG